MSHFPKSEAIELNCDLGATMQLRRDADPFGDLCDLCQSEPPDKDASLCRQCRIEMAEDYAEHERVCGEHAARGGSYDTRPVYVHPRRRNDPEAQRAAHFLAENARRKR